MSVDWPSKKLIDGVRTVTRASATEKGRDIESDSWADRLWIEPRHIKREGKKRRRQNSEGKGEKTTLEYTGDVKECE